MLRIRPKADLVYGASGTRKTTQIGLIALYVWKKFKKRTRMITMDGGGFDPLLGLVNQGIIKPWVPIARTRFTISTIDLACQGYWPKDADDPNSPLVAPTPEVWEEIGFTAIEGLTSGGDGIIRQLKADKAHLSQDPSYTYAEVAVKIEGADGRLQDKVISYSGGNMSYYGSAQDQLYDFVLKSHMLPCEKVLWTALEGKGEEEGSKAPTYGPAIVGRKSTGKAPQWFGNTLHIEQLVSRETDQATKQVMVIEKPVMYLRTHADPVSNIPFPCKTRAPFQFADRMPASMEPDMGKLYTMLDELNDLASQLEPIPEMPKVSQPNQPVTASLQAATHATHATQSVAVPVPSAPSPQAAPAGPAAPAPAPVQAAAPAVPSFVPPRISVKKP